MKPTWPPSATTSAAPPIPNATAPSRGPLPRPHQPQHPVRPILSTPAKIIADNFRIKIESNSVVAEALPELIGNLSRKAFRDDPEHQEKRLAGLPNYRLSAFQPALPGAVITALVDRRQYGYTKERNHPMMNF